MQTRLMNPISPKWLVKRMLILMAVVAAISFSIDIYKQKHITTTQSATIENKSTSETTMHPDSDVTKALVIDDKQVAKLRTLMQLPTTKKASLQDTPSVMPNTALLPAPASAAPPAQRCTYSGQSYLPGDIVKTDQGWLRCTPTLLFLPENPRLPQSGSPAWTTVQ